MTQYLSEFFKLFITFFIIMDPIGNVPLFCSVTNGLNKDLKLKVLRRSVFIAGIVLAIFSIFGRLLLSFFNISPGAFYVSGGILFFTIAYELIQSKPRIRQTPASSTNPQDLLLLAVFPLAIPLTAGPGMITTVIVTVTSETFCIATAILMIIALIICLALQYISLRFGDALLKVLGTTGMFVLEKIMGLVLAALAIQLVYDGLVKLGVFPL